MLFQHEYSTDLELFLTFLLSKLPGRKGTGPGGWMIQAKLQVYFWLGSIKHKKSYPSGLPPGFQVTNELLNAERPGLPPPISIHYAEKHVSLLYTMMLECYKTSLGQAFVTHM